MAKARAYMKSTKKWPAKCARCKKEVQLTDKWVVGHIKSRVSYPELMWDPRNWRIEHRKCSDRSAQSAVIEKAKRDALRSVGVDPSALITPPPLPVSPSPTAATTVQAAQAPRFSPAAGHGQSPPLPVSPSPTAATTVQAAQAPRFSPAAGHGQSPPLPVSLSPEDEPESMITRDDLAWDPEYLSRFEWLQPLLEIPEDAAPPLMMTPVPEDAVGTYGWMAIEWIEAQLNITLRWWQRLSLVRQLEHRADGSLCFRTKVESAPRRAGKSVGLRGHALWRMEHGAAMFGETQTLIHTGSDLNICREIQRGAWHWSEAHGWAVTRGNGKEAIESPAGARWMTRAQDAVYGYDVTCGMVDEGWNVKPDTVSEGLEPGMLERLSPQLIMTSTAHRRATSLMRTYLTDAMTTNDPTVLLLLWAAPMGSNPGDPAVWRAASPHWSEDRRAMIAAKYEKALAGQDDPEFDDPDPMAGFEAQYLNIWKVNETRTVGNPVISSEGWEGIAGSFPETKAPDSVAVEAWFGEGVSVARAWKLQDAPVVVSVTNFPDLPSAASYVSALGPQRPVLVGASLADNSVWRDRKVRVKSMASATRTAVGDLTRFLAESKFLHDNSETLTAQVLGLRVSPGVDGPRIRSTERGDAIKAAMWAVQEASLVTKRMVLPTRFQKR